MKIRRDLICLLAAAAMGFFLGGCKGSPPESDPPPLEEAWLQGYAETVDGGTITYHSPHPDVNSALLVRSLDSADDISWVTERVPEDVRSEYLTFVWIFGIDVDMSPRDYDLYINGKKWFRFSNPETNDTESWSIAGKQGSSLRFRVTLVDRYGDVFGYAAMRLPADALPRGKALNLRVAGESAGSRVWYMTFQSPIVTGAQAVPRQALIREKDELRQPVDVQIVHLGDPVYSVIEAPGLEPMKMELQFGFNQATLLFPESKAETTSEILVKRSDRPPVRKKFLRHPVRPWTVYLVQHTHTDIGYTRPQTEILAEHIRFIDYALDYCDATDDYPDDARFRWTCEAAWAVNEYVKSRPPEQVQRLARRLCQGRIEVTALPFNLSEMADENLLAACLQPLRRFKNLGFPVRTAMQNDVNGIAWCFADYLPEIGVRYLNMGQHGHRARIPFDRPTPFWWESPSGRRILAFRADHYMTGNFWGIHTGHFPAPEKELLRYLEGLEQKAYPYDRIAVQYSGFFTDNSPPSLTGCEFIRRWNQRYAWPRLRSATAQEFFAFLEDRHARDLPVHRVAWPDWWSDGFGSAARETAAARKTQSQLTANQGLLAMARLMGARIPEATFQLMEKIRNALLFWDEHTMGAAESIRDPLAENSMVQWAEKSAYAWEAVKDSRLLEEAAMGLIQPFIPRAEVPTLVVFNTLNWNRSGLARVYIDHEILRPDQAFRLTAADGSTAKAQVGASRADGTIWYIWVEDIPAFGYKLFRLERERGERRSASPLSAVEPILENRFYRVRVDPDTGGIKSLIDKIWDRELVDPESPWPLGGFIYESLTNRGQLEQFRLVNCERTGLEDVSVEGGVDGPLWKSLRITGRTATAVPDSRMVCEIRLFHDVKRIGLHYSLVKRKNTEPEAFYIAFPFRMPDGRLMYEAQGGMVTPGEMQLEGTASDWHAMQTYVRISDAEGAVLLGSDEIPLLHLGGLNLGQFRYIVEIPRPHLYSWVMNNYWVTNFRASQEGEFTWGYNLTSDRDLSLQASAQFGWGTRVPLPTRVFPAGAFVAGPESASCFTLSIPHLLLVTARPDRHGSGIILQLRETGGKKTRFSVLNAMHSGQTIPTRRITAIGEIRGDFQESQVLLPLETAFFELRITSKSTVR